MSERHFGFYFALSARKGLPPTVPIIPKPVKVSEPRDPHDRHAAITRKISDWNEYKRWAQTARIAWDTESKK